MRYITGTTIKKAGIDWNQIIKVIDSATYCLDSEDYAQPIKPYLRYKESKNRIIAMPAYVGGNINKAGIKWIASFPNNVKNQIPRAHSVVILNNADTGNPEAIINTALLSVLRTAGVTGSVIKAFGKTRKLNLVNIGIIGWGPIGQYHLKMISELLRNRINHIYLYDLKPIDKSNIDSEYKDRIIIADSWEEAYIDADIFITCTVSKAPYINKKPKEGSLQLNVSLRDYKTDIYQYVKNNIIVDDWDEICREKTDIEMMHLKKGLKKEDTKTITDIICREGFKEYAENEAVMFNPMGLAIFDIALADYYVKKANSLNIGLLLEDSDY